MQLGGNCPDFRKQRKANTLQYVFIFLLFSLFMPYIVVFKSTVQKYDIYSIPPNLFSPDHIEKVKGDPVLPSWVALKTYFVFILTFQKNNLAKIVLVSIDRCQYQHQRQDVPVLSGCRLPLYCKCT